MRTQANTAPMLNDLEWQAVSGALVNAATCGCSGIAEPTGLGRALRTIFAAKATKSLSDPRSEAVRRFVCEAKRSSRPHFAARAAALSVHGYNDRQIAAFALLSN